jgi:hypothetical protein
MKMSRFTLGRTKKRIEQIAEAFDHATTDDQRNKAMSALDKFSWAEWRVFIKVVDEDFRKYSPLLLTLLVNLENEEDVKRFRKEFPNETRFDSENILRLRNELREVWEKPQREVERAVAKWFDEVPMTQQHRWFIRHELSIVRPVNNLAGSMARALFQWRDYCSTCANPACNGKRFVASRKDQKYCLLTEECAKYGHRAASRRHYQKRFKADGPQNMKESTPMMKGTR